MHIDQDHAGLYDMICIDIMWYHVYICTVCMYTYIYIYIYVLLTVYIFRVEIPFTWSHPQQPEAGLLKGHHFQADATHQLIWPRMGKRCDTKGKSKST